MKQIIIILLLLPLPFFLGSLYIFNDSFWEHSFDRYAVQDEFDADIKDAHDTIILYLLDKKDSLPDSLSYNQKEIVHMDDVKVVFQGFLLVLKIIIILLGLFFIFNQSYKNYSGAFYHAGLISIIIFVILALLFVFSFAFSFSSFHTLFFAAGSWVFSPGDTLVTLYPSGLFADLFRDVMLLTAFYSLLFMIPKIYKQHRGQ
ncbi:DUF1461 domain-containing protein [Candidatus Woesearchaeota archaeon]|nr:DUF1461 domain-containing protein [Candidatus Woesearchaeota archaeon]